MWSRILVLLLLSCSLAGQTSAPTIDNDFVHEQFGDSCNLETQWKPMIGDLNGDKIDDLVFIARCQNPLIDQGDKDYKVIDPMDAFFGYGNPKITAGGFGQDDPKLKGICVLVIHGSGSDAWRSATPLAKFVIINIAVKTLSVKRMKVNKKKFRTAIYLEEATGDQMTAAVFWDGRKYRYSPLGSSLE